MIVYCLKPNIRVSLCLRTLREIYSYLDMCQHISVLGTLIIRIWQPFGDHWRVNETLPGETYIRFSHIFILHVPFYFEYYFFRSNHFFFKILPQNCLSEPWEGLETFLQYVPVYIQATFIPRAHRVSTTNLQGIRSSSYGINFSNISLLYHEQQNVIYITIDTDPYKIFIGVV